MVPLAVQSVDIWRLGKGGLHSLGNHSPYGILHEALNHFSGASLALFEGFTPLCQLTSMNF